MNTPSIRQDVPCPIDPTEKMEIGTELTDLDIGQLTFLD